MKERMSGAYVRSLLVLAIGIVLSLSLSQPQTAFCDGKWDKEAWKKRMEQQRGNVMSNRGKLGNNETKIVTDALMQRLKRDDLYL